jgi:ABC-2 type transport system permease protein
MNLLRLELQRNLTRRLTRIFILIALVGISINGVVQFATHNADEDGAAARDAMIDRNRAICLRADDPFSAPYETNGFGFSGAQPAIPTQPGTIEREQLCRGFEFFIDGRDKRFHLEVLRGGLIGFSIPLIMLALLLGASYIGAEWRANTVATQLVWEPRRVRVALAKLAATIITALGVYLFLQLAAALSVLPSIMFRGTTEIPPGWWSALFGSVARAGGLVLVAATAGYALASIGRNTSAAIGAAFVYLMILEGGLIGSIFPGTRRFLVVGNAIVWMTGSSTGTDVGARSMVGAGLLLLFYAGALAAASIAVFRARDIS